MHRLISFLRHCWCWYHIFYLNMHSSFLIKKNYNCLSMLRNMIMMKKRGWLGNSHQKEVEHRTKQSRTHPMTRLTIQFDKTRDTTWYIWIEDNSKKCLIHYQTCKELSSSLVTTFENAQWRKVKQVHSGEKYQTCCLVTRSQTQLLFQELPFSLLGQVYPKPDRDYHSVPSTTRGDVWVFINREVGRVPYKGPQ